MSGILGPDNLVGIDMLRYGDTKKWPGGHRPTRAKVRRKSRLPPL